MLFASPKLLKICKALESAVRPIRNRLLYTTLIWRFVCFTNSAIRSSTSLFGPFITPFDLIPDLHPCIFLKSKTLDVSGVWEGKLSHKSPNSQLPCSSSGLDPSDSWRMTRPCNLYDSISSSGFPTLRFVTSLRTTATVFSRVSLGATEL